MNLGGQSQNFPFYFFDSSADSPPAPYRLPVSGGSLGGAKPPPDGSMHSGKARGHVQVHILSEKLNLDLKLEHVSWQGQCASPSTRPWWAAGTASEWTGPSGGGFALPRPPPPLTGRRSRAGAGGRGRAV